MASIGSAAFASGPYSAVWNSLALGLCEGADQSPAIRIAGRGERIQRSNSYGDSPIAFIWGGRAVEFRAVMMEWSAAVRAALFPHSATDFGDIGPLGVDNYSLAQPLVLTAASGSLAAAAGPLTLTANKAVLSPDQVFDILFGPVLRRVGLVMDLYQYAASSLQRNFSYT